MANRLTERAKIKIVSTILLWFGSFLINITYIDKMNPASKWVVAGLVFINMLVNLGGTVAIWIINRDQIEQRQLAQERARKESDD